MRNFLIVCVLLSLAFGCNSSKIEPSKKIDFEIFEIIVPESWKKMDVQGMDSYAGGLRTSNGDSVYFDFGKNTYKMDKVLKVNHIKEYKELDSIGFDVGELLFSKYPSIDQNQGTFHDEYYLYEKIDQYDAKISVPKRHGNGVTAVFFDNLPKGNALYIYAKNVNKLEQGILIEVFKSITILNKN